MTDSEAIQTALQEAGRRRHRRAVLQVEVVRLATDSSDLAEMRAVREHMAGS